MTGCYEESRQSQAFLTYSETANEVSIEDKTLKPQHYLEVCIRIVEYNKIKFRPIVEDAWREINASRECPTLAELTHRCGLLHYNALEKYFPDVAEQLRALDRRREVNHG